MNFFESITDYFFFPHFDENEIIVTKFNFGQILHTKCKQSELDIIANYQYKGNKYLKISRVQRFEWGFL